MSNWKRTSEEMPPSDKAILFISDTGGCICLGFYDNTMGYFHEFKGDSYHPVDVRAWCPIPEYDLEDE